MKQSLNKIAGQLALRRDAAEAIFHGTSFVPLLPILEHPYLEVQNNFNQVLEQAGFSSEQIEQLSFEQFISWVLKQASSYWIDLALQWLEQGHPVTKIIESSLSSLAKAQHISQHTRHRVVHILDMHATAQFQKDIQAIAELARREAHSNKEPHQLMAYIRDSWRARHNGQTNYIGILACITTAFDIPLRNARDIEGWQGLFEKGHLLDEDVDSLFQPWIDAYRKRNG